MIFYSWLNKHVSSSVSCAGRFWKHKSHCFLFSYWLHNFRLHIRLHQFRLNIWLHHLGLHYLRAKINFVNMLKIVQKSRKLPDFWTIFNISECLHTQIKSTTIFIKISLLDNKWQGLQYCNFHQYQHIFTVAGWNHPYIIPSFLTVYFVIAYLIKSFVMARIYDYIICDCIYY